MTWQIKAVHSNLLLLTSGSPRCLNDTLWDHLGPIDRDIRKFSQHITEAITFDSFCHNHTYNQCSKTIALLILIGPYPKLGFITTLQTTKERRKVSITFYLAGIFEVTLPGFIL